MAVEFTLVGESGTRVAPVSSAADLRGGRLLIYFPDGNLSDGAAEAHFDVENTPPWDIWVAFGVDPDHEEVDRRAYLVAWVPEPLLALANRGIRVNPEECICWLDEVRSGARDELRAFLR